MTEIWNDEDASMTRQELLEKAAAQLQAHARELRQSHTVGGMWVIHDRADQKARDDHDELLELASGLLRLAHGTFEVKMVRT